MPLPLSEWSGSGIPPGPLKWQPMLDQQAAFPEQVGDERKRPGLHQDLFEDLVVVEQVRDVGHAPEVLFGGAIEIDLPSQMLLHPGEDHRLRAFDLRLRQHALDRREAVHLQLDDVVLQSVLVDGV